MNVQRVQFNGAGMHTEMHVRRRTPKPNIFRVLLDCMPTLKENGSAYQDNRVHQNGRTLKNGHTKHDETPSVHEQVRCFHKLCILVLNALLKKKKTLGGPARKSGRRQGGRLPRAAAPRRHPGRLPFRSAARTCAAQRAATPYSAPLLHLLVAP